MANSFNALTTLKVGPHTFRMYKLEALISAGHDVARLPFALKVLLENLLRNEDGQTVTADDIKGLAQWDPHAIPSREIAFRPSRVLLQDFTGVPAVVDLAAMRDAMKRMGGDPRKINPLQPVELVIDHSVQVDEAGTPQAFRINADLEFSRNRERYAFLRWGQNAFLELPGRSSRYRDRPSGESRVPGPGYLHLGRRRGRRGRVERRADGLSRHSGRHRLAHDHD